MIPELAVRGDYTDRIKNNQVNFLGFFKSYSVNTTIFMKEISLDFY